MSRSRRRRQPASTQQRHAMVYTTAQRATNEHVIRTVSAGDRCLITGIEIPLTWPDRQRYIVHVGRDERPIPLALESSQPYPTDGARHTHDYNGGHDWTVAMYRYMRDVISDFHLEALRLFYEWWRVPRVFEHVVSRMKHVMMRERLDAVLAYQRDHLKPERIIGHKHSMGWFDASLAKVNEYVRSLLPHTLLKRLDRLAAAVGLVPA